MDLEQQIEDDLINLKLEMDTNDFGKAAIEEDQKREILKSKTKSSTNKSVTKKSVVSKKSVPAPEGGMEE